MGKLDAAERKALPKGDFGLPKSHGYPMPDASHARNAKARASQAVNSGRMSKSTEERIDAMADRKLKKAEGGAVRGTNVPARNARETKKGPGKGSPENDPARNARVKAAGDRATERGWDAPKKRGGKV